MITGEIGSADLHDMSNMDMASKDLMEARKQQEKDHLDKIKRLEEERQKEVKLTFLKKQMINKNLGIETHSKNYPQR